MALFGSRKKKTEEAPKEAPKKETKPKAVKPKTTRAPKAKKAENEETKEVAVAASQGSSNPNLAGIIKRPRVTEKASMSAESNVFAFEVATSANKKTIAAAIKDMFNVTPVKVAIVPIPKKQVFVRNKKGITGGGKKAYVYLKKGDTIEFV